MSNIIILDNKYCRIESETDTDFIRKLDKFLSFQYEGWQFLPAAKRGWDGRVYLLSKKLEFMIGLLDDVKSFYELNSKTITLIDNRQRSANGEEIDIFYNLKKLNIIPYDYQIAAVEEALQQDRMIFKHATGSGKTLSSALITAKLGKTTIIYVISKDLLYQFHEFYSKIFNEEIGIIGDGICVANKRITIASIHSIGRSLGIKKNEIIVDDCGNEKFDADKSEQIINCVKKAKIHLLDECHVSSASTIRAIYKIINPEKILGFSGTPWRDDGSEKIITGIFGKHIHEVKASELIKRGILAKPFIKFVPVKGQAKFTDNYNTVYNNNVVNSKLRNHVIMREAKALIDKGYQVLVLFKTIKHGKILRELFEENDVDCEFLSGNDTTKVRNKVKNNLLSRKTNCLIASTIYDLGVDISTLSALVLAGAGKSSVKTLQRVGRVIRDGKNKPYAAIVEIHDVGVKYISKHSMIRKSIYETEPEFVIQWPGKDGKKE